jgi:ethanolamine kinase
MIINTVVVKNLKFTGEKLKEFQKIDLDSLRKEMNELENLVQGCNVAFCHNDLLSLNIIYDQKTDTLCYIDYEYCGYNYQAFDIGNHFCEYAGFDLKIPDYPGEAQQKRFARAYLEEYNQEKPTDQQVEILLAEAGVFAMVSRASSLLTHV